MNYIKKFNENFQDENDIDLALEIEYKFRTLKDDSEFTVDDFFDEFGIESNDRSDFAFAAILKEASERFNDMTDEEFFEYYKKNKS